MLWWSRKEDAATTLYMLKYSSTLMVSPAEADTVLATILACALRNNPELGITGMLYYDRSTLGLVQTLEGPKDAVEGLYTIICADQRCARARMPCPPDGRPTVPPPTARRHGEITLLEQREIDQRAHIDFGMALARVGGGDLPMGAPSSSDEPAFAEHLVRLQYTSKLVASDVDQARQMLKDILAVAMRKNAEQRIGGLLCFNPTTMRVTQLLEGPAAAVRALFLTIMADPRHEDCCLTNEELLLSKADYLFGSSWGMMQTETETAEARLVDLPSRIQAFHAQAASAAMDESDNALGVPSTPMSSFMM